MEDRRVGRRALDAEHRSVGMSKGVSERRVRASVRGSVQVTEHEGAPSVELSDC